MKTCCVAATVPEPATADDHPATNPIAPAAAVLGDSAAAAAAGRFNSDRGALRERALPDQRPGAVRGNPHHRAGCRTSGLLWHGPVGLPRQHHPAGRHRGPAKAPAYALLQHGA